MGWATAMGTGTRGRRERRARARRRDQHAGVVRVAPGVRECDQPSPSRRARRHPGTATDGETAPPAGRARGGCRRTAVPGRTPGRTAVPGAAGQGLQVRAIDDGRATARTTVSSSGSLAGWPRRWCRRAARTRRERHGSGRASGRRRARWRHRASNAGPGWASPRTAPAGGRASAAIVARSPGGDGRAGPVSASNARAASPIIAAGPAGAAERLGRQIAQCAQHAAVDRESGRLCGDRAGIRTPRDAQIAQLGDAVGEQDGGGFTSRWTRPVVCQGIRRAATAVTPGASS